MPKICFGKAEPGLPKALNGAEVEIVEDGKKSCLVRTSTGLCYAVKKEWLEVDVSKPPKKSVKKKIVKKKKS